MPRLILRTLNRQMKAHAATMFLLLAVLCQSCCTRALWRGTDPHEVVWISTTDINDSQLIARGAPYRKYVHPVLGPGYLVEKAKLDTLRDYTLRVLASPFTIVIDGVVFVVNLYITDPRTYVDGVRLLLR